MDTRNHGTTRGRKPSASRKSAGRNMRSKEYDYDPYEEDYGRTGRKSSSSYRRDDDYDDYEDEVDDRYETEGGAGEERRLPKEGAAGESAERGA